MIFPSQWLLKRSDKWQKAKVHGRGGGGAQLSITSLYQQFYIGVQKEGSQEKPKN